MKIDNIPNLKIYKLTKEQYERRLVNGEIEENAFYFTPGTSTEAAQPLHVYLYGDEENGYYADTTVATIFDAVCNQSRDVQLVYETVDFTRIFLLDYCNEESVYFSYHSGVYCETVAIYDDGAVEYSYLNVVSQDYADRYYLQKPQTANTTASSYLVGMSTTDNVYKVSMSDTPYGNYVARYDKNGRLQSKYYDYDEEQYKEDYVATEQYVWREINSVMPIAFSAYEDHDFQLWIEDEDFDLAMEQIYNNWRNAVLYIETGDGDTVEQVWGAEAAPDYNYIIFGNRYIWYRDDNRLYPYTPPETKKYELIETVNLSAGEVFERTAANGQAYNFERVMVKIKAQPCGTSFATLFTAYANNILLCYFAPSFSASEHTQQAAMEVYKDYGYWRNIQHSPIVGAATYGNARFSGHSYTLNQSTSARPAITKICCEQAVKTDMEIEIWGVRR